MVLKLGLGQMLGSFKGVSSFAKLDPRSPLKNKKNEIWKIFVNAEVEPDEV